MIAVFIKITFSYFKVELWQKYIAWEKSNPLRTEDTALLTKRVVFALEQCLLCLGHHPDIWYQAAQFLEYSCKILAEKGVCYHFIAKKFVNNYIQLLGCQCF